MIWLTPASGAPLSSKGLTVTIRWMLHGQERVRLIGAPFSCACSEGAEIP
jgi:hypothetical protein